MFRNLIFIFCAVVLVQVLIAQPSLKLKGNEYGALNLNFTYGAHLPAGKWQERFGFNFSVGGAIEYITHPGNIILGIESHYIFGGNVKEDPLANIKTTDGEIIGNDLTFANVVLRERGLYTGLTFGKLFQTHSTNLKEGIRATASVGYLWHKIRIQDDYQNVPQVSGDYRKGYDRLTSGFGSTQFIGYQKLDRNRRINFIAGFEFMQAYTGNRRDWDFDLGQATDKTKRIDLAFGIRIAWILPFYVGMPSEDLFY
jgi:hypothetical protein